MAHIRVFHNPQFLDYCGGHSQIVRLLQPTASVKLPEAISLNEGLGIAYVRTQHGYRYASWFHDPEVIPHLRSTTVGISWRRKMPVAWEKAQVGDPSASLRTSSGWQPGTWPLSHFRPQAAAEVARQTSAGGSAGYRNLA